MPTSPLTLADVPDMVVSELEQLADEATKFIESRHAKATRRAYLSDFASFKAWCARRSLPSMPAHPGTVALYLFDLHRTPVVPRHRPGDGSGAAPARKRSSSSVERALAGIVYAHRSRNFEWPRSEPTIAKVMASVRRNLGTAPTHQKVAVDDTELGALLATTRTDVVGVRDRAVLTLGWRGAFRRSELVALHVEDVTTEPGRLLFCVRSSKTDQEGAGELVGVFDAADPALCARRALEAWLAASGITSGPIFRAIRVGGAIRETLSDRSVALIIQRAAKRAGLDPAKLGGHSLRAGFATTASAKGKSTASIARHLRHKSESTTKRYVRHQTVFRDNPSSGV